MLVLSQNCIFEHMTDKCFLVTEHVAPMPQACVVCPSVCDVGGL